MLRSTLNKGGVHRIPDRSSDFEQIWGISGIWHRFPRCIRSKTSKFSRACGAKILFCFPTVYPQNAKIFGAFGALTLLQIPFVYTRKAQNFRAPQARKKRYSDVTTTAENAVSRLKNQKFSAAGGGLSPKSHIWRSELLLTRGGFREGVGFRVETSLMYLLVQE